MLCAVADALFKSCVHLMMAVNFINVDRSSKARKSFYYGQLHETAYEPDHRNDDELPDLSQSAHPTHLALFALRCPVTDS